MPVEKSPTGAGDSAARKPLTLAMAKARPAALTPMLRQFLEAKSAHPDAVLFYRMGDFFELFFEDAVEAAPVLEVALTARHKGTDKEVPMCGVPHHSVEGYIGKMLRAGLKVAICDQVENPAQAKGLVKREVTRIITPGTISSPELLDGKEDNLLAALVWRGGEEGSGAAAFLDVSTGTFYVRAYGDVDACVESVAIEQPKEILYELDELPAKIASFIDSADLCRTPFEGDRYLDRRKSAEILREHFGAATLRGFGLDGSSANDQVATEAAAGALEYARATQLSDLGHIQALAVRSGGDALVLDATTQTNLEIFRNLREGTKKATLWGVLDRTRTAGGGRRLADWLRRPLNDPHAITERHDAVGELYEQHGVREQLREHLAQVGDLERLLSRAVFVQLTPREASVIRDSLRRAPGILQLAGGCQADLLADLADCDPLEDLCETLETMLAEQPPALLKNGGVIASGVDEELDRCRSLARDAKKHIAAMEVDEREKTGISSLKIRYNKVFGYYLEVTKANSRLVPEHYIRKQTLVNAERYVTPAIKELEEDIVSAEERQMELEKEYFERIRLAIVAKSEGLRELASAFAVLDVIAGFADVAQLRRYSRPWMRPMGEPIDIEDGRHPVVEITAQDAFVPNDVSLGEAARIVVLTGPNMGGKSTYLRQVALIVLMAQVGSFVPATKADIGVVDRIFTRVGASDNLARGESTFMVEMIETANIVHHASAHSLVILDEVGRGTSTFDGMSLAWAIVEYLHRGECPKTLFATHYHELTELAELLPGVVNRTLSVKEWQDQIVFLRRVIDGSADKSYGLHVARLAGLPAGLIERAGEVLANLEKQEYDPAGRPRRAEGPSAPESEPGSEQMALFTPPQDMVAQLLRDTQVEQLTPLAALNLIASLKSRLG